jgi:hypothetical protein
MLTAIIVMSVSVFFVFWMLEKVTNQFIPEGLTAN